MSNSLFYASPNFDRDIVGLTNSASVSTRTAPPALILIFTSDSPDFNSTTSTTELNRAVNHQLHTDNKYFAISRLMAMADPLFAGPDATKLSIHKTESPKDLLPPAQLKFGRSFTGQ